MSGAASGFTDPANWHGSGLLKTLIGLPIAGAIGSPQWIKKYPQSAAAAAAIAATVLTAGAAAPAVAGAAGAGEGAAAGAGATGAFDMMGTAGTGLLDAAPAVGTGAMDMAGAAGTGLLDASPMATGAMDMTGSEGAGLLGGNPYLNSAKYAWETGKDALNNPTLKTGMKAFNNYQKTQSVIDSATPKQQPLMAAPRQYNPGPTAQTDPMPTTPFSPADPVWQAWLKRHGKELGVTANG